MEIVSYGGIPKNLTKEEFLSGKTDPVNKDLMKIFLQCGIVEQSGHGVPIVVKQYGENAYEFSENMIKVTIPFNKSKKGVASKVAGKLNATQEKIVNLMLDNPQITIAELQKILKMSDYGTRKSVKSLKEKGIIKRVGSDKTGSWKVLI